MKSKAAAWLHRQKQRIPLFVQSIASYLLVLCVMIITLFTVVHQANTITTESYLNERQYALQSSVSAFERQLENFRSVAASMHSTENYLPARFLRKDMPITNRYYYVFLRLLDDFSLRCVELVNAKNTFLYLANSDSVIWREGHFSFHAADYLDRIELTGQTSGRLTEVISSMRSAQHLLPARFREENGVTGDYLLYLYNAQTDSGIYGMLLARKDLNDLFHMKELPEDTSLTLHNTKTDEVIYQSGTQCSNKQCYTLTESLPSMPIEISVTIPASYFADLTQPITALLTSYIVITVIICLLISLWLSRQNAVSMRKLLQVFSNAAKPDGKCKNELIMLDHNIRLTHQQNEKLQQQIAESSKALQLNMLSRLMVQESFSHVDEHLAQEHLPSYEDGARVMCMEFELLGGEPVDEVTSYQSRLALESVLPKDAALIQMRLNLFAALLHDRDGTLNKASGWISEIHQALSPIGLHLSAGLSERFSSLSSLHEAYVHALYTLRYNATPPLSIYTSAEDDSQLHFSDLSSFRNAVIACDEKTSSSLLDRLLQAGYQYGWLVQALRFTLDSVCMETRLDTEAVQNESLRVYMQNVIASLMEKQRSASLNALSENVLQYLQDHFADSSLSADSVAEQFNVSRSYLYRIFRESYGLTPSDKLEQIRMEHAQKLLDETRMNVTDIASACGYNSSNTFYKAYKKRYGCAPNASRGAKAARDAAADE